MVKLTDKGIFLTKQGEVLDPESLAGPARAAAVGRTKTMAYKILKAHNQGGDMEHLKLTFDALVSPDNNYVNILQTARASGIRQFPVPYVLSNCHHTLCAVGGTINEDDHVFGLGNVKKYGGIFVPPYKAVLHQYMREMMAGCGKMILGSDSHTRYGALGTLGIGEGGGEVAKQLLSRTYDLAYPPVIGVKLTGTPRPGVGPQDVALALVAATFQNHFCKNKILEFVGDGISGLTMEYRMGIDVMTTESGALSSIWCTDQATREYLEDHGRGEAYRKLEPEDLAYYDGLIEIDLSRVECMIALPFHPSNAMPVRRFKEQMGELLSQVEEQGRRIKGNAEEPFSLMSHVRDGEFYVDQALVSGCSGGLFENVVAAADILKGYTIPGNGLGLGINPASLPVMEDLMTQGIAGELAVCGVTLGPAICGPCFGVTDVPANNQVSIRHVTRNYPNREGSKPGQGQMAAAFLMDARSIAATVRNGGRLTAATELEVSYRSCKHHFNREIYRGQVFDNFGKGTPQEELVMGPNMADWPEMYPLSRHLLMRVAGAYEGSVTTDELIPSGEASSFRSNPEKISGYMLVSRDPAYVERARTVRSLERQRRDQGLTGDDQVNRILQHVAEQEECQVSDICFGSLLAGEQVGDGSSREQAASCQKVLGGFANLANEYSTKRYRSNLINWGLLPLRTKEPVRLKAGDYVLVPNVRDVVAEGRERVEVLVLENPAGPEVPGNQGAPAETETHGNQGVPAGSEAPGNRKDPAQPQSLDWKVLTCTLDRLTEDERQILLDGCLINFYKK